MAKRKKLDIEAEAIQIVRGERQRWEVSTAFITDRVSFKMRQLIRILRKNYYGIFDQPKDEFTGQEKIWYPLTEINVEAVVKNIDLDQKDLGYRAKNPNGYGVTDLVRAETRDALSRMYFGQKLDDFERTLAIDGTAVWKTYEENGKAVICPVDLLNIWIDPTSPSIQQAYRFTERSLMFPEEIAAMDWMNNTDVIAAVGLPRTDPLYGTYGTQMSNVKASDVWEMWGKFPEYLITGDRNDTNEIDGRIVVSGIETGNDLVHLIERNTKTDSEGNALKPYEEAWYTRVPNRWYGRGVAEKLLTLQVYANIVFNVRINRSRMSQLGLFKIRKGAGITPQMLSRLPSNGAIVLNSMDDLEQFEIQEVGATSYKDEDVLNSISERLTNAFQVATGENMPASTPATNAALQSSAAKSGFALIKDGIGSFLERWNDRHFLPITAKNLSAKDMVRFSTDDDQVKDIVDTIVNHLAVEAMDIHYKQGVVPTPQELQMAMDDARNELLRRPDLFVGELRKVIATDLFTQVQITNESMDVGVTIQNIISLLGAAPEYRQPLIKEAFDLMGLGQLPPAQPVMPPGGPQGSPQGAPSPMGQMGAQQLQGLTTSANV
jgi:hypothetical protein